MCQIDTKSTTGASRFLVNNPKELVVQPHGIFSNVRSCLLMTPYDLQVDITVMNITHNRARRLSWRTFRNWRAIVWQRGILQIQTEREPHWEVQVSHVCKVAEPSEVHEWASGNRSIGIEIVPLEHFTGVMQRVQDRALSGTIGAEEKRERLELQIDSLADPFEILD